MPVVRVKKRCCKSGPRCRKCPVVLNRLAAAGHAERIDKRHYLLDPDVRKKAMKKARK